MQESTDIAPTFPASQPRQRPSGSAVTMQNSRALRHHNIDSPSGEHVAAWPRSTGAPARHDQTSQAERLCSHKHEKPSVCGSLGLGLNRVDPKQPAPSNADDETSNLPRASRGGADAPALRMRHLVQPNTHRHSSHANDGPQRPNLFRRPAGAASTLKRLKKSRGLFFQFRRWGRRHYRNS